jgi:ribosome biogenesis GTPase
MTTPQPTGLVVASHGRHCLIETPDGQRRIGHPRGKKSQAVVGDRVQWQPTGDEASIEAVLPRRNLLHRQDELRTKSFAANLDHVLMLVAAEPAFSESQLARALIAAQAEGVDTTVVLNKSDLVVPFERALQRLAAYRAMGLRVLPLSLQTGQGLDEITATLAGRTTLVLGPSGAGKSTLINRWVPDAQATTGAISTALQSGRHTTTTTTWYWLDNQRQAALIDSLGFQAFGLHHIAPQRLAGLMPDLAAHLGHCRFHNCSHLHEPGCGVLDAVGSTIDLQRHRIYRELYEELSAPARH